ncbi:hypothetical protein C1Y25_01605 [Pseudomonas sp. MPBC4-3]|nr:hypothetical protein C1Y25_01605 [Pseudomonas sp. MPBC4-3]PMX51283.1 hypothetical protein C1Y20_00600 [Pseudomonas sp. FW301-21B01]PNA73345.1 hypothetical protein C1Y14_00495 [Pseudomonas sp. MPR-R5B]
MLAKNLNDNACCLNQRGACGFFASKLAPTKSLNSLRLSPCLKATFTGRRRIEERHLKVS